MGNLYKRWMFQFGVVHGHIFFLLGDDPLAGKIDYRFVTVCWNFRGHV